MATIGERLKEERTRLGLNQTDFAALADVGKHSQIRYEKNEREPDTGYLERLAEAGVDIQYVLSGTRGGFGYQTVTTHLAEPSLPEFEHRPAAADVVFVRVPMLEDAGGVGMAPVALDPAWLAARGLDPGALACIRVSPGQMLDLIGPGDLVLLDRRNLDNFDGAEFAWFNSRMAAAEIGRLLKADNQIICAQGSPARVGILVPTDHFRPIGRIVAHWRDV